MTTTRHRRYYSLQRFKLSPSQTGPFDATTQQAESRHRHQDPIHHVSITGIIGGGGDTTDDTARALVMGYTSDPELSMNPRDVPGLLRSEAERGMPSSSSGASEQEQIHHGYSGTAEDPFLQHLSDGYVSDPETCSFQEISFNELQADMDAVEAVAPGKKKQVHRRYFSLQRAGFGSWMDDVVVEAARSQFPHHEVSNLDTSKTNRIGENPITDARTSANNPKPERRSSLTLMHRRFWSIKKEEMRSNNKAPNEVDDESQNAAAVTSVAPVTRVPVEPSEKKKDVRAERAKLHRRWQSLHRDGLAEVTAAPHDASQPNAPAEEPPTTCTPEQIHPLNVDMPSEGSNIDANHHKHNPSILDTLALPSLDERHVLTAMELHVDSSVLAGSRMVPDLTIKQSPTSVVPTLDTGSDGRAEASGLATSDTKESAIRHKLHPQQRHRRWQSLYREGLLGDGGSGGIK